ncbi:MAG TPA: tyrosine-protein phosphatase [Polyangiaceae bacterium]|nr:tyrosine-protein phosphatase [Polyangiaceae bacterium]
MRRAALATLLSAALALSCGGAATATRAPAEVVAPTGEDWVRNVGLVKVQNVRDLGGLRGSRGFIPHGRFYRAATLVRASDGDRNELRGRGVTLDIDLRTFVEAEGAGDRLSQDPRFRYRRISLLGVGISDWFRGMHGLYLHALDEHRDSFREVFHAMATHEDGAILFHCTSGKDRTGMVTALLLDLAGVDRETIVRDYAISAHYLGRSAQASPPDAIVTFLHALDAKYGGARSFLARIGLPEREIHALLARLGQG